MYIVGVCESGQQYITDACVDCEIGYYRDKLIHLVCMMCPQGFITDGEGAKEEAACTIGM